MRYFWHITKKYFLRIFARFWLFLMNLLLFANLKCYNSIMNNLLTLTTPQIIAIAFCIIITAIIIIFVKLKDKKKVASYSLKDSLITASEREYLFVLQAYFGNDYIILPQVNLASIIDKQGEGFRNELFRNVDFGIFDFNYRPLVLIEINDNTHFRKDRQERDLKVQEICKKAKIPLVTFWVKDGIDSEKIYKTIKKYL